MLLFWVSEISQKYLKDFLWVKKKKKNRIWHVCWSKVVALVDAHFRNVATGTRDKTVSCFPIKKVWWNTQLWLQLWSQQAGKLIEYRWHFTLSLFIKKKLKKINVLHFFLPLGWFLEESLSAILPTSLWMKRARRWSQSASLLLRVKAKHLPL